MNPIDPREFGRLEAEVKSLGDQVESMQRDIKALLALANKGKGGFWMGMTMASFVGGFISWIASHASWFK